MAPLVIPDTAQVTLFWNNGGIPYAQNVFHFDTSGLPSPVGPADANTIAGYVTASWNDTTGGAATLRSQIADEITCVQVGVRSLDLPNEPMYLSTSGTVVAGTATGDPLPAGVALVTTFRTNKAGRSYRGRIYIPGFSEGTNSSQGLALAATVAAQQNAMRELLERFDAGLGQMVVASRKLGERFPIISCDTNTKWDTQRRRSRNL